MNEVGITFPGVLQQFEGEPADATVQRVEDSAIHTYRLLTDIGDDPIGVLHTRTGREVSSLGNNAADVALQIFGNVVLNAYEAIQRTGEKSGCIEICAAERNNKNVEMVELSIRDTGVGLEQNSLTRIFQRGFTSKEGAGSGLGLHWCANAVGVFGGSIRAESPGPGRGTTVHIVLPAAGSSQTGADVDNERMPSSMPA